MVLEAGDSEGAQALERLCRAYWYPAYAYARRQGLSPHDAQDVTQGYFADLLRREDLAKVAPEFGKFRSFLMVGLRNYIANSYRNSRRQKRGGGEVPISIDEERGEGKYRLEPATPETPETVFERNWAFTLLQNSIAQLETQFREAGKSELFRELSAYLPSGEKPPSIADLARRLGIGESAATMKVHRLRQQFGGVLLEELRQTVSTEDDLMEERNHLLHMIGS